MGANEDDVQKVVLNSYCVFMKAVQAMLAQWKAVYDQTEGVRLRLREAQVRGDREEIRVRLEEIGQLTNQGVRLLEQAREELVRRKGSPRP